MVGAVIVAFYPDISRLMKCYYAFKDKYIKTIVVLNSEYIDGLDFIDESDLLVLGENLGIAAASNLGAFHLFTNRAVEWFIFSDQDTFFPDEYFNEFFKRIQSKSENVLAPVYFDEVRSGLEARIVQRLEDKVFVSKDLTGDVYQAIASGLAIRSSLFLELNGFREDLFIDWVDMELCWRAYKSGARLILLEASLNHRLGDSSKNCFGRLIPIRNAIRYYYLIRNGLYLALNFDHGSRRINLWFLRKVIFQFTGYFILSFGNPSKLYLLCLGVIHGLRGRLGKL
jgi:rhamnosyltransferase